MPVCDGILAKFQESAKPAPLRGMVMHRAFLQAMRTGKAGSWSVDQRPTDPLAINHPSYLLKTEGFEVLLFCRYFAPAVCGF
jgi:hypothetical protein